MNILEKSSTMERTCTDCRTKLTQIRVLDYAGRRGHAEGFEYTLMDAKRSAWSGMYPPAGSIHAWMCPECGRVQFYAETARDSLPLPSTPPAPNAGSLPLPSDDPNDPSGIPPEN